jgi:hypothetical protein
MTLFYHSGGIKETGRPDPNGGGRSAMPRECQRSIATTAAAGRLVGGLDRRREEGREAAFQFSQHGPYPPARGPEAGFLRSPSLGSGFPGSPGCGSGRPGVGGTGGFGPVGSGWSGGSGTGSGIVGGGESGGGFGGTIEAVSVHFILPVSIQ